MLAACGLAVRGVWQEIIVDPRGLAPYGVSDHDADYPETYLRDLQAFERAVGARS